MSIGTETPYASSLAFLLSQIGARSARLFADRLGPIGILPREFGVLSNLDALGDQTQQQLADALGMHRNNMVGLVDELEAKDWVRRHRSTADRRAFDIRLTAKGRRMVRRAQTVIPTVDADLAAELSEQERTRMVALLRRMAGGLDLSPGVHPHLGGRHP